MLRFAEPVGRSTQIQCDRNLSLVQCVFPVLCLLHHVITYTCPVYMRPPTTCHLVGLLEPCEALSLGRVIVFTLFSVSQSGPGLRICNSIVPEDPVAGVMVSAPYA